MKTWLRSCLIIPLGPAVYECVTWWPKIRNEFFVLTGARNESGGWYGFHSGIGGAAYFGIPLFVVMFWWHHQCGVHGCYWYARRTTAAGERACWKHHPHKKRTVEELHEAHHAAVAANKQVRM